MKSSRPYAVYRMFDKSGALLYVGCTFQLLTRIKKHEFDKIWSTDIANITAEWHDDKGDAITAERKAIMDERPIWNIRDNFIPTKAQSRFGNKANRMDRLTWVKS